MSVEVVGIAAECLTQSVTIVEHGCDTVEAESVEVVFLKPVLAVGEQEVHHVVLAIVEAKAVPSRMLMTVAGIEILIGVAGKVAQSLYFVLHCMRMYYIHDYGNTVLMGCVDHLLQLLGSAESA